MNKLEVSTHETLIINILLHYKFLTIEQLSKLLKLEIDSFFMQRMEEKLFVKTLRNKNFDTDLPPIYFALPNKNLNIDSKLYFQDIDLRQLSVGQDDYFHIYNTVNYHILFNAYSEYRHIKINYFSAYFDAFKNKTKKDQLEASGKFMLNDGDSVIPNATMNFSLSSGNEFIYVLDLFGYNDLQNILKRVEKYNQILIENIYKLDRVIFIFKDDGVKNEAMKQIDETNVLQENKNSFIFKTVQNLENDFSLKWMLFNNNENNNVIMHETQIIEPTPTKEESVDAEIEDEIEFEFVDKEEERIQESKETIIDEILIEEELKESDEEALTSNKEKEIILEEMAEKSQVKKKFSVFDDEVRNNIFILLQDSALFVYMLAGIAAFVVSAYMEMIAFDSFYPGFFLISVVMVIAFEVAKVGSIFMKVYIKNSKSDLNKIRLRILSSVFIPLLFGLSIISSMAVTADKLESPHAEELKAKSIQKIQTEYDDVLALTEKDHLRRTSQLKKDFFEKIAEFENRKKEVIADKDAEIEKQKSVYGTDGKTWKGSKYEEHIKERTTLIGEFASERMRLENLYNDQIEQESAQYRKEKKEDLLYKTQNLSSAESEVLANSWQAQNEMVRSFIKVVNHGFHLKLKELDFIFMLSILISILLELTIYKVFSNVAIVYAIRQRR